MWKANRSAKGDFVGTLAGVKFDAEEIGVRTTEKVSTSETQYIMDFLNSMDVDGSSEGTYFSSLEEAVHSELTSVYVCDDYTFAKSKSY